MILVGIFKVIKVVNIKNNRGKLREKFFFYIYYRYICRFFIWEG